MPDRRCKRIFAMLSEYLDAELPVETCDDLERHLKGCKPCLAYLETLKTTVEVCRRYKIQTIPPPSRKVLKSLLASLR